MNDELRNLLLNDEAEKYLQLVERSDGEHRYIKDPFNRAIAMAFELAMEEQIDPWEIDLAEFAKIYLKKLKEEVDLPVTGKIILMAWIVLKMQSDRLINDMEGNGKEDVWEEIEFGEWNGDHPMIEGIPIQEKVRRKGKRKATLVELIQAFEDARKEVELREHISKKKKKKRERMEKKARKNVGDRVNKEDIEKNMGIIWKRIKKYFKNDDPIPLKKLCNGGDKKELLKTFIPLLFLANEKKIKLSQKRFPYGEIYIKNIKNIKIES